MEETNFIIETNHLIEFDNKNKKCGYVRCPYVYENLCTNEVIVMEYIDGIKINDIEGLRKSIEELQQFGLPVDITELDISKGLEKSLNIQKCVFRGFNNIIIKK